MPGDDEAALRRQMPAELPAGWRIERQIAVRRLISGASHARTRHAFLLVVLDDGRRERLT
jgi:hypothetical protein